MPADHKTYNQIAGQNLGRIEALSDGVFAIAMTLLVLDLRVPVSAAIKTEADLYGAFCALTPNLLSYFLSFMTLGIFWTGISTQFGYIKQSDRHQNWLTLFFLLFVSLAPFTTAFLSQHILFKFAVGLYWLNIFLLGLFIFLHWAYALKHGHLSIEGDELNSVNKALKGRVVYAQLLYAGGAALCFISTYLSVAVIIAIQLNYALAIQYRKRKI